jgi:DNA-binding NarL/FixJ family response regulator
VEEAGRELAAQLATDVLIIEDEALIAFDLEALVENFGHKVTGVARTRSEAVTIARNKPPGLILADIGSPTAVPVSMRSTISSIRSRCR